MKKFVRRSRSGKYLLIGNTEYGVNIAEAKNVIRNLTLAIFSLGFISFVGIMLMQFVYICQHGYANYVEVYNNMRGTFWGYAYKTANWIAVFVLFYNVYVRILKAPFQYWVSVFFNEECEK